MRILIGGSPCTHWSIARNGRETEPSSEGWELFLNYLIALRRYNPDYFLYENVASMTAAIKKQITQELGVAPILVDSGRVSAQRRKRLYWTNIPNVEQPKDRGITVKDILDNGEPLTEKAYTLRATYCKAGSRFNGIDKNGHSPAVMKAVRIGTIGSDGQGNRVYSQEGKSVTINANSGGQGGKTGLYAIPTQRNEPPLLIVKDGKTDIGGELHPVSLADGAYTIRKLTVAECRRLQTIPDWYTFPEGIAKTHIYKMLGNGWTVEVIRHVLSHIPDIQTEPVHVLSMYDGMACGGIALREAGATIAAYMATEIDRHAIKTAEHNFPQMYQMGDAYGVRREEFWRKIENITEGSGEQ